MRILYVEDERSDMELMKRLIKVAHHHGIFASGLEEARDAIKSHTDLILLDIVLDQTRVGDQLVQELRSDGYQGPIVAVTGLALSHEIQQWHDMGFTEVLTKPFEAYRLMRLFEKYAP
jgi:CheY-like chemotaxis protein